jgi:hypothetical protein
MTTMNRVSILFCVLLMLVFYGCASRPDEQLNLAQEAMKQAADVFADQYAPAEWKSAKEFWDQAQDQLGKQQYAAAAETLLRAKTRFTKAKEVAQAERESMLKQVKDIQAHIESRYTAWKESMPPAKLSPAVKKDFQAACADIDKRIEIVTSLVSQGDYMQAKTLGQQALQAIDYNEKKLKK